MWAMVQSGDEPKQMQLGSLVSLNGAWKLVDGPVLGTGQEVLAGVFFDPGGRGRGELASADIASAVPTEQMQNLLTQLQEIDTKLNTAGDADRPALYKQRAEKLREIADSAPDQTEKEQWLIQLADSVSAATQSRGFPDGVAYLKKLEADLANGKWSKDLQAHVKFQRMVAEYYGSTLVDPNVKLAEAQDQWMKDLEAFATEHPKSDSAAEAMRAIAMGSEMSGQTEASLKWYRRILADFPDNVAAQLAQGAINRLTSEGREIALQGTDVEGNKVNLADLRGKAVVIQYWTTSSDVCVADHSILKDLIAKYGGKSLEVISINLDYDRSYLDEYLNSRSLPWKHIYSERGFDGKLAHEMGVVTVPLNLLVGPDGKVISSNIQAAEVESELKKLQVAGLPGTSPR